MCDTAHLTSHVIMAHHFTVEKPHTKDSDLLPTTIRTQLDPHSHSRLLRDAGSYEGSILSPLPQGHSGVKSVLEAMSGEDAISILYVSVIAFYDAWKRRE